MIELGNSYKTHEKLWDDEFRGKAQSTDANGHAEIGEGNEFGMTTWYTSTRLEILTDAWRIASGALQAKHELRGFSIADARSMAGGNFRVSMTAADQGRKQNATNNVHMVMDLGGEILQPANKNESNSTLSRRVGFGTQKSSTMNGEFAFALPASHGPTARLVLIDKSNKQHAQVVDFSKLR